MEDSKKFEKGAKIVVVLPSDAVRPQKVRKAEVVDMGVSPALGAIYVVDIESEKKPGKSYRQGVKAEWIHGPYEGEHSIEAVKAKLKEKEAKGVGSAMALTGLQVYAYPNKQYLN